MLHPQLLDFLVNFSHFLVQLLLRHFVRRLRPGVGDLGSQRRARWKNTYCPPSAGAAAEARDTVNEQRYIAATAACLGGLPSAQSSSARAREALVWRFIV